MIKPEDAEFHTPTSEDPTWAETNFFGFYVPEVPLNVGVYALFRTNAGVVISTVAINSRFVDAPWQADYWDAQHHLPIPKTASLRDYQLNNGLKVVSPEPNRVWDVEFDNGDGIALNFRYTALMDAFDIHDPDQDPIVAAKSGDEFAWDEAYNGHFDQTGHFEGEINVRGKKYPIDCVSTMDHSWGPRAEYQSGTMSWLHAHFSRDLAFHGIFAFSADGGPDAPTSLTLQHGYLIDHDSMYGLSAGTGRTIRQGYYAKAVELDLTDTLGRSWQLQGSGRTSFPWQAGPGTVGFNVLAEWRCGDQLGWGELQDFIGPQALTKIYSEL